MDSWNDDRLDELATACRLSAVRTTTFGLPFAGAVANAYILFWLWLVR